MTSSAIRTRTILGRRPGSDPFEADATSLLSIFILVLVIVPANLIVQPLGAAGTPAAMLGTVLFVWWLNYKLIPGAGEGVGLARGVQPVRIAIGIFAFTALASYAYAALSPLVPVEVRAADRATLKLMAWAGVVLVAADGIRNWQRLETLLRRVVLAGGALSVATVVQFWTKFNVASVLQWPGLVPNGDLVVIDRSAFTRPTATAVHPIELGVVLAAMFPLAFHFAFRTTSPPTRWQKMSFWLIAFAAPLTVSRSAILGLVVGFVLLFLGWTAKQRLTAIAVAPAFLVVMRLLVPGLVGTIRGLFTNIASDPSYTGRTDDYAVVAEYVARSPLIGRGFGTFVPGKDILIDRPGAHITLDNQYLGQVIEMGVLGLIALLALFLVGYACARGARRRWLDEERRHLALSLAASIGSIAVMMVTFDGLGFPMVAGFTMLLIGCAGAMWRIAVNDPAA